MLILEAEILFSLELPNDISTKYIIRPAINFGNNLLFSGTIIPKNSISEFLRGRKYNVTIELPTIEEEAYEHIAHLIEVGNSFNIQYGFKYLGNGRIDDFIYY
jgi:hypothetical protein